RAHHRRAQARPIDRLLAQSGDATRGNRSDRPVVRGGHGAGFDRYSGSRPGGLEGLRRQAALRRRAHPQDLHFPAQPEPAHSAASGQIGCGSGSGRRVMADIPLIRNFDAGTVFAFRNRRPIRVEEFLGEVRRLADLLPDRRYVVNLCSDRYRFAAGLVAALLRRQVSLLPPNSTDDFLNRLSLDYPGAYCLGDGAAQTSQLETFRYPPPTGEAASTASPPHIPEEQVAAISFTSGSTGRPRPHPKSWGALARSGQAGCERLCLGAYRNMSVLGTIPHQHMYGLEA